MLRAVVRNGLIIPALVVSLVAPASGQLSPDEAMQSIRVRPGFRVELVATEPQIVDPIAMCFDENGAMYVCEMRGFQLGPGGRGASGLGTIRRLQDRDHDGRFETATVFADGLTYPSTVTPWAGGVLVGAAPDILFLKDTDGDGRADVREVLYTGFGQGNHEQLLNSMHFAHDNWIHGCAGGNGGDIQSTRRPTDVPVSMRKRNFRFRPHDRPLEATTGGGQYGLTCDGWGRWLTCSNSNHIVQIVLPEEYLRRNEHLAVGRLLTDISDHEPAAKLYRISPLEEWRVIRTRQRAADPDYRRRLRPTELVPGGFVTAACGLIVYRGGLFGSDFVDNTFVCDASNNVVHRDVLVPDGVTLLAKRATSDGDHEFFASTDNWCRPCFLAVGPDGGLYVVDMYRQIIETPNSIPAEIQASIDMEAGNDAGRIYRIVPESFDRPPPPRLGRAATHDLVDRLAHPNAWQRLTAQRLLLERRDPSTVPSLRRLAETATSPTTRLHLLWTLDALGGLDEARIVEALGDPHAGLRENAIRLAESRLTDRPSSALVNALLESATDARMRVRFQSALMLGDLRDPRSVDALMTLAERDSEDEWMRTAILSSSSSAAATMLTRWMVERSRFCASDSDGKRKLFHELAVLVGSKRDTAEIRDLVRHLADAGEANDAWWQAACLTGLAEGLRRGGGDAPVRLDVAFDALIRLLHAESGTVRRSAVRLVQRVATSSPDRIRTVVDKAKTRASNDAHPINQRIEAIERLALAPIDTIIETIKELLSPRQPPAIQLAAISLLKESNHQRSGQVLVDHWHHFSPTVRADALAALTSRRAGLAVLLDGLEQGAIQPWNLDAAQRDRLMNDTDPATRSRALKLLGGVHVDDRQAVLDRYQPALELAGSILNGKSVFQKRCGDCHQLAGVGHAVGPDLAGVRDRPASQLLEDIIVPSHALVPGYESYAIETVDGEILTGILAAENANSFTLRQAKGVEVIVPRRDVERMASMKVSIMPTDLQADLSHQDVADLIAFLKTQD